MANIQNCQSDLRRALPATDAFAILGKRQRLDTPASMLVVKKCRVENAVRKRSTSQVLRQLQLSLGQIVQKRCDICGMSYVVSSAEDRKLHDAYHAQSTHGCQVSRDFTRGLSSVHVFDCSTERICVVHCFDQARYKRRAQYALEIAQKELGAVEIDAPELWDERALPSSHLLSRDPIYHAYMYIKDQHCVGLLLVHQIDRAFPTSSSKPSKSQRIDKDAPAGSTSALAALRARRSNMSSSIEHIPQEQSISVSQTDVSARLGISRIWVASKYRRGGIAMELLNNALRHQQAMTNRSEGCRVRSKADIAFSQPTTAGTCLARRWFGKPFGWLVYFD